MITMTVGHEEHEDHEVLIGFVSSWPSWPSWPSSWLNLRVLRGRQIFV